MKTIKNFLLKKRKILKSKAGFSLMELLIVVTIMGVISAIAIPAYDTYRGNANQAGAKAEAKTVYRALQTCLASGKSAADCSKADVNSTLSKKCVTTDSSSLVTFDASKHDAPKQIAATPQMMLREDAL